MINKTIIRKGSNPFTKIDEENGTWEDIFFNDNSGELIYHYCFCCKDDKGNGNSKIIYQEPILKWPDMMCIPMIKQNVYINNYNKEFNTIETIKGFGDSIQYFYVTLGKKDKMNKLTAKILLEGKDVNNETKNN